MESQSVSAQLYFKQLPNQQGGPGSDSSIEEAFQKQLDLSEYYKSKTVFDTMKRDYMDKTMEGSVSPPPEVPIVQKTIPDLNGSIPVVVKDVEKSSFVNATKSTFGASGGNNNYMLIVLLILAGVFFFFLMKNN